MNRTIARFAVALALAVAIPATATAEEEQTGRSSIDLEGGIHIPVGDFGDVAGIGIAGLGHFVYTLNPQLAITAGLGLIYHLPKSQGGVDINVLEVPVLAGVRFNVAPKIIVFGQFGIDWVRVDVEGLGDDSEANPALRLGGAYEIGALDLGASLMFSDIGNAGDSMGIMITAAIPVAHF